LKSKRDVTLIKVAFKLLLVLSIVLQSLTAVSATSQKHQIDFEHLQTQHDHQDDLKRSDVNLDEEGHDVHDCHHCGHCSGSHLSWILTTYIHITPKLFSFNKTPHQFDQTKEFLDAILRPPIS
jgi:hypothetical protein